MIVNISISSGERYLRTMDTSIVCGYHSLYSKGIGVSRGFLRAIRPPPSSKKFFKNRDLPSLSELWIRHCSGRFCVVIYGKLNTFYFVIASCMLHCVVKVQNHCLCTRFTCIYIDAVIKQIVIFYKFRLHELF